MWPEDINCAVCLSFDFDAEALSLGAIERKGQDGNHNRYAETLTPISRGQYGAKVGISRSLKFKALIKHMQNQLGVWFATCWDVATHWAQQ